MIRRSCSVEMTNSVKLSLVGWVERPDRTHVRTGRETHRFGRIGGFRKKELNPPYENRDPRCYAFNWARMPAISPMPQCSAILPPPMRKMSHDVNRTARPVGATPI